MKETIVYGLGALVLVASVGLFYNATNSDIEVNSCSVATTATKKENSINSKQNYSKTNSFVDKNKTIEVATKSNSKVNNKTTQNSNSSTENSDKVQMPKELKDMQQELESIKQEEIALLEQTDNLLQSMDNEDSKLEEDSKEAENILKEFEENNIIDVQAIKQEVEEMAKPIAIEDAPQEVKPALEQADNARLELEKKLIELKLVEKGE